MKTYASVKSKCFNKQEEGLRNNGNNEVKYPISDLSLWHKLYALTSTLTILSRKWTIIYHFDTPLNFFKMYTPKLVVA